MAKQELLQYLDGLNEMLSDLALDIWNHPEISGQEQHGADAMRKVLREYGFSLHEVEDMPHAFYAECGQGSPVIAILGEYDALPGLSQACTATRQPLEEGAPGHACGHNLLGTAALGAALALKNYLETAGISGTVRYYGCPEEETLVGKVRMIQKGAFEGCDIALSWHPMNANVALPGGFLANNSIKFRFHGISAHAAASPESGRSALDAVELMNVGANYLREHVIDAARIHYTITNAGGAPNIVPPEAESWYYVRAPHRKDVAEITARLIKISQGAAMMTETTTDYEIISGCYEMLGNQVLCQLTHDNLEEIPKPEYSAEELAFAGELQASLDPAIVGGEAQKFFGDAEFQPLFQGVVDQQAAQSVMVSGSSDSGDVSWIMPMNLFLTATWPVGVPAHSWQAAAASGSSLGLKGMLFGAKIFAGVAYDLFNNTELVEQAKAEFAKRTAKQGYVCPLNG